jgi:hypothetical protein
VLGSWATPSPRVWKLPGRTSWLTCRLRLATLLVLGVVSAVSADGLADEVALPAASQIDLLAKVVNYDRNFRARAGARARIVLMVKPGDVDSLRAATQMMAALSLVDKVGGLPHDDILESYRGPAALADLCRSQHVAIVIVGPGFRDDTEAIRAALDGVDVLSVSAVGDYVPKGIVLGFDLVGGHPRMLVHLTQAKRQHVSFLADVLKLMQVYE